MANPTGPEVHVFGIPGAGKTTWMAKKVKATVQRRGPRSVLIMSFTRAAAHEIASRDLPIPQENIGTVHAMAYRAIGRPALTQAHLKDWNAKHPNYAMSLRGGSGTLDEAPAESGGATDGDKAMAEVDILRAKMVPPENWPLSHRAFWSKWTAWKADNELVDFTDMIERALAETTHAPGEPEIIFVDEVQDQNPLEFALIRKWGQAAERLILAGDNEQLLYRFRGADANALLDAQVPHGDKIFLDTSWRCPPAVLSTAERWVAQLTRTEPRQYIPRGLPDGAPPWMTTQGSVMVANFSIKAGDALVLDAMKHLEAGKNVMIQAACGYQLDPVKDALRRYGVPYHNPYRPTRGDWNPLGMSTEKQTSSSDRLAAYLIMHEDFGDMARPWSGRDIKAWSKFIKSSGVFRRGAKQLISNLPDRELEYEEVLALFLNEEVAEAAMEPSVQWFSDHVTAEGRKALDFPLKIVKQHGPTALGSEPQVMIGTCHSFKGGEATVTYLCPDLSYSGAREWDIEGESRDSVVRQFYVGMTRAMEDLIILQPSGNLSAPLIDFVR